MDIYRNTLRQLPTRIDGNNCFVCGPDNPHGLHMTFYTDAEAVYSWVHLPDHVCGWKNIVHGGILATILDETMGWATLILTKRFAMTTETKLNYRKPVLLNDEEIRVESRVLERSGKRKVIMEGRIYQDDSDPCVTAQGSYSIFTIEASRKLNLMDQESLDWVVGLLEQL